MHPESRQQPGGERHPGLLFRRRGTPAEQQEGRLFKPLAFTKTFAMAGSAFLSITLVPVLMGYLIKGRIRPEHANPINRVLQWVASFGIRCVVRNRMRSTFFGSIELGRPERGRSVNPCIPSAT